MLATPRLPAVIPTRIPGLIPATRARTWARVSPAMSSSTGASKRCRTRTIRRQRRLAAQVCYLIKQLVHGVCPLSGAPAPGAPGRRACGPS